MSLLIIVALLLFFSDASAFDVAPKLNLFEVIQKWTPPPTLDSILESYQRSQNAHLLKAAIKDDIVKAQPFLKIIESKLTEGLSLARSEWLHKDHDLRKMQSWMQFQVLTLGSLRSPKLDCLEYQKLASTWFYFLAEMAYQDPDSQTLSIIYQWRGLLLNEVYLRVQNQEWNSCQQNESLRWWRSQRFPSPVDRLLVSEMRRLALSPKERAWMTKAVIALQKNPHKSLEEWLKSQNLFVTENLKKLSSAWSSNLVQQMQAELSTHQKVTLILMSREYFAKHGSWPKSQSDLVKTHYLTQVLVDPQTRKEHPLQKIQ